MIQQTLVLVKPDGVSRGLIGEIIKRIEQKGLKIIALKLTKVDRDIAKKHYTEEIAKKHGEKIRDRNLDFLTGSPVVAMIIEGVNAIENVRTIIGVTESKSALPGTIRGDFSHVSYHYADSKEMVIKNVVHASGNKKDAKREIALWFSIDEIHSYKRAGDEHLL